MQVGGAFVPLSSMAEIGVGAEQGTKVIPTAVGTRKGLAPEPFYPAPLARCMAFLLQSFHKESIEKIKNMASRELRIKFLQNTKWKGEKKNRNRESHDLHKSYICWKLSSLASDEKEPQAAGGRGPWGAGERG